MTHFTDEQMALLRRIESRTGGRGLRRLVQFLMSPAIALARGDETVEMITGNPGASERLAFAKRHLLLGTIARVWDSGIGVLLGYDRYWHFQLDALNAFPHYLVKRDEIVPKEMNGSCFPVLVAKCLPVSQLAWLQDLTVVLWGGDEMRRTLLTEAGCGLEWVFVCIPPEKQRPSETPENALSLRQALCFVMQHETTLFIGCAASVYKDGPYTRMPTVCAEKGSLFGIRSVFTDAAQDLCLPYLYTPKGA